MNSFRLALVEDSEEDIQTCKASVSRYQHEKRRDIELIEFNTIEDARRGLDNSFDGAIVDLKFGLQGDEGNEIVSRIVHSNLRIPIAIMTGTPSSADVDFNYIGVFKKGETEYVEIIDKLWDIHDTGLTRIMGGRGIIEEVLNEVFQKNMLPQIGTWIGHGKADAIRTEKAFLRHVLGHLLQLLDDDEVSCFPEEFYISPPLSDAHKTGSIVKNNDSDSSYVILTPACDLVIRTNGKYKTDRILLVEIEPSRAVLDQVLNGITNNEKKKTRLKDVYGNNYTFYYHWLPKTNFFEGGIINFRKLTSIDKDELVEKYARPTVQISPFFIKDIVARFSTFYARQGQPDIDFNHELSQEIGDLG